MYGLRSRLDRPEQVLSRPVTLKLPYEVFENCWTIKSVCYSRGVIGEDWPTTYCASSIVRSEVLRKVVRALCVCVKGDVSPVGLAIDELEVQRQDKENNIEETHLRPVSC